MRLTAGLPACVIACLLRRACRQRSHTFRDNSLRELYATRQTGRFPLMSHSGCVARVIASHIGETPARPRPKSRPVRSAVGSAIATVSISPPFLSTGGTCTVHWRLPSRPCGPTGKTISLNGCRPRRATGCTASTAYRNSGLTTSVGVVGAFRVNEAILNKGLERRVIFPPAKNGPDVPDPWTHGRAVRCCADTPPNLVHLGEWILVRWHLGTLGLLDARHRRSGPDWVC